MHDENKVNYLLHHTARDGAEHHRKANGVQITAVYNIKIMPAPELILERTQPVLYYIYTLFLDKMYILC